MRRNWMDDLAKGVDTGYKLGQMYRDNKMQNELRDANKVDQTANTEYTPDQIRQLQGDSQAQDGETWDENQQGYVNQAGGLRKPTNVPTLKDGQYSMDGGQTTINPATQYRLGIQQQDHAFSPDEVAMEKLNRKADIYSNYGKEDMAETMRNNASSRGLQAQNMRILAQQEADNADKKKFQSEIQNHFKTSGAMKGQIEAAIHEYQQNVTKDPLGATRALAAVYNKAVPDGQHVFVNDNGAISLNKEDGSGGITDHNVFNPEVQKGLAEELRGAVEKHIQDSMPIQDFAQWQAMKGINQEELKIHNQKKQFEDKLKQDQDQFITGLDWKTAEHNDEMGLKRPLNQAMISYYNSIADGKQNGNPLNALQSYQLEQQQKFDTAREQIANDLEAGKITDAQARSKLNVLGLKFGSQMKDPKPEVSSADRINARKQAVAEVDGSGATYKDPAAREQAISIVQNQLLNGGGGASISDAIANVPLPETAKQNGTKASAPAKQTVQDIINSATSKQQAEQKARQANEQKLSARKGLNVPAHTSERPRQQKTSTLEQDLQNYIRTH